MHIFDLLTLTYELDLDILPLDLHAKIQVCMSVRSVGIATRTDTHTHTNDVKTSVLNRSQNSESIITELFDSIIDSKSIFGQIYQVILEAT